MSAARTAHVRYVECSKRKRNALDRLTLLGLGDQHQVPNIPCDRADQHIFLFHHLTYFHKLNAKAATKLIRALIINKDPSEPLFHYNDTIIVSDSTAASNQAVQHKARRKKKSANAVNYQLRPDEMHYSNRFHTSALENFASSSTTDGRTKVNNEGKQHERQLSSRVVRVFHEPDGDIHVVSSDAHPHRHQ